MLKSISLRFTLTIFISLVAISTLLPLQAFAVAMFDAEATTSAEITSIFDSTGSPIPEAEWLTYVSIFAPSQGAATSNTDPTPPNNTLFEASFTGSNNTTFWGLTAGTEGEVSVPGFAESSLELEYEIDITNLFEEPNGPGIVPFNDIGPLTIEFSMDLATILEYDLQTSFETLDELSAFAIVAGNSISSGFSTPIIGPSSSSGPSPNSNGPLTWSIPLGPGETYTLSMMTEVMGGVSATATAIPEPSTLFLLGTGLLGVAGIARRRKG